MKRVGRAIAATRAALNEALGGWGRRAAFHVRISVGLSSAACAIDTWVATRAAAPLAERLVMVAASAGVGVWTGIVLGLGVTLGVAVAGMLDRQLGISARLAAASSSDAADRHAVVRLHAWIVTALVTGALAVAGFAVFVRISASIMEDDLRKLLIVLAAAAAMGGTLAGTAALLPLSSRAFAALDRRWRLPLPRQRSWRFVLYQLVPGAALALFLLINFGSKLGIIMQGLGVLLFLGLARAATLLAIERSVRSARGPRRARWGLDALAFGLGIAALVILQGRPAVASGSSLGAVLPYALSASRAISDVDGDGVSSLFGGRDCAPFDGGRSPALPDTPGNGVDENCDGRDAQATSGLAEHRVFHGALGPDRAERHNVLWLIVDSLRADHLPLYGYERDTSPALTRFGEKAWVFDDVVSQSSTTSLSLPSMFSGRWPGSLKWTRGPYPKAVDGEHFIAHRLAREGYYTALVMNSLVSRRMLGVQHGFERKLVTPRRALWRGIDYAWSNAILAMNEAAGKDRPFFIAVHVDDVHHPYRSHKGRAVRDFPNRDKAVRDYDRSIAVFDQAFSQMLAHLENARLLDDTIVIVTSDHGEEFREHGHTIHSRSCYAESVRVPLVMRVPGFAPARVAARTALVDIVPTLLEALGLAESAPALDGQSLFVPVLDASAHPVDRPIFCTILKMKRDMKNFYTRSVRTEHHTFIHEMFSDGVELYDTRTDPGERQNLAHDPAQRGRLEVMKAILDATPQGNLFESRTFR